MEEPNNIDKNTTFPKVGKQKLTEEEREEIIRKAKKDVEDCLANLKPSKYTEGWAEDRWEEEMEKHPLFMSKGVEEGESLPPLVEAMQQVKFSPEENTPEELAMTYKEEGNYQFKICKFRFAVDSYSAGIDAGSEDKALNAKLYSNRSFAHFKIGNYKLGLKDAKMAKELDPDYTKSYYRGALCAFYLSEFSDCIVWCEGGLKLEKDNKSLLEMKDKAEKSLAASCAQNKEVKEKEKKEKRSKDDLRRLIASRGVTLADNVVDIHDVMPNVPFGDKVYVVENQLVWPVFFLYPEYEKSDFVQKFNEETCFQYHLDEIFRSGYAEWDNNKQYRSNNLQLYFNDRESLIEVSNTSTLKQVLADPRYKVRNGVPDFFVTVKNSVFDEHFRTKHEFV